MNIEVNNLPFGCGIIVVIVAILAVMGWVFNLIAIISLLGAPVTGWFVLRILGLIFVPLGVILGWIPV